MLKSENHRWNQSHVTDEKAEAGSGEVTCLSSCVSSVAQAELAPGPAAPACAPAARRVSVLLFVIRTNPAHSSDSFKALGLNLCSYHVSEFTGGFPGLKKKKNDLRVVFVKFRTLEKSQTVALLFPGGFSGSAVTVDAPGQAQALPSPTPRCMSPAAWSPPLGGENVWLAAGASPGEG